MLNRLRSAIYAGLNDYRTYPARVEQHYTNKLGECVDEVFHELDEIIGPTTVAFIKRYLKNPTKDDIDTFLGSIDPLPNSHKVVLMIAVGRVAPTNWVMWPSVMKWSLKNSSAMAAYAKSR